MSTSGGCGGPFGIIAGFMLLMASVGTGACTSSGDAPPPGDPDSGVTPSADASRETPSSSRISCSMSGAGCLCVVDDPQPSQIDACGPTTVIQNATEVGICCTTLSLCSCGPYSCRSDPAAQVCQCGTRLSLASLTLGTPVAECPPPTEAQKCCLSRDNGSCICSRLACAMEETAVANCSAAAAGACATGESIDACR